MPASQLVKHSKCCFLHILVTMQLFKSFSFKKPIIAQYSLQIQAFELLPNLQALLIFLKPGYKLIIDEHNSMSRSLQFHIQNCQSNCFCFSPTCLKVDYLQLLVFFGFTAHRHSIGHTALTRCQFSKYDNHNKQYNRP